MVVPWDTTLSNKDKAIRDFTEGQRIKETGKHEHAGHRADFYWIVENNILKMYIEESRQRKDWKDNLDFLLVKCPYMNVRYHKGFYINACIVTNKTIKKASSYDSVEIYSYSQGAAVAQIYSDIMSKHGVIIDKLVTFGCPNNVVRNKTVKALRVNHVNYVQGWDFVYYGIFWLKKYGRKIKLKGRGNPFKSHNYYHLEK